MRRLSLSALTVLQAVANGFEYGFDVIDATGLPSGTVYPALSRLERDGYLRSAWEDDDGAHREGRPARRYYRVIAPGARVLAETLSYYRGVIQGRLVRRSLGERGRLGGAKPQER
jgi:DNA-binding PadR family transcriptional regulator